VTSLEEAELEETPSSDPASRDHLVRFAGSYRPKSGDECSPRPFGQGTRRGQVTTRRPKAMGRRASSEWRERGSGFRKTGTGDSGLRPQGQRDRR
jgi:hypothetical protein